MVFIKYGLLGALLASSSAALAMWTALSDCELVDSSELIVNAEFVNTLGSDELTRLNFKTDIKGLGILRIHKTYKGTVELTNIYVSQPSASAPISSSDIFFNKGQTGIWFLTKKKGSSDLIYYANHPQRYWPNNTEKDIEAVLNFCNNK